MASYTEAQKQISHVDRLIDIVRNELIRRVGKIRSTPRAWQAAWDRHPDLRAYESALFYQRGGLQIVRDAAYREKPVRAPRYRPPAKCPACKGSGFAKAA